MRIPEALDLTLDLFRELYDENNGFNYQFNKNHPSYSGAEDFDAFLLSGCSHLMEDYPDIVKDLIDED